MVLTDTTLYKIEKKRFRGGWSRNWKFSRSRTACNQLISFVSSYNEVYFSYVQLDSYATTYDVAPHASERQHSVTAPTTGEFELLEPERTRTFFPETWLWSDAVTG